MAGEWRVTNLADVCERVSVGYVGPTSEYFCEPSEGVRMLRSQNVRPGKMELNDVKYVRREFHHKNKKSQLKAGDILFVRVGQNRGDCCIVPEGAGELNCANIVFARPQRALGAFLGFYFRSFIGQQQLRSISTGSAQGVLNTGAIASLKVPVPTDDEAQRIASVLGALDDKIELNRRINVTLEAMARALFQSWFVDFDPVRAKLDGRIPVGLDDATASLFPDLLEESTLGHIPKGWTAGQLGDIGTNSRRSVQPSDIALNTPYIALEHMPRRCIALGDWDDSADVASGKSAFKKGEILFGKLRPYFHKVGVAPFDGVCSTDILVLAPKSPEWFGFLLGHASSDELIQFTDLASTGTKMPRTNWSDISSFKVALPPKPIAAAFTRNMQPLIDRIHANLLQSRTLAILRDTLLPKLLSGELSVVTDISK
jgi:type I restriction enzyme S subunit